MHLRGDAHVAYRRADMQWIEERHNFRCLTTNAEPLFDVTSPVEGGGDGEMTNVGNAPVAGLLGAELFTYMLAVGATGEYTAFHGGTVAGGLSAVTTSVSRLNQIYERDFAIRMQLVANQNTLIFTNAGTDPYTAPSNGSTSLNQNQSYLDANIGNANYDIGHVYYRGASNGIAGLSVIGVTGQKGRGYSAGSSPQNDPFVIDYVAHEMGHQYGGEHTFNSCGGGQGGGVTAEPGSGSTIMSYAGICNGNENLQSNSDAMFHAVNYQSSGAGTTQAQILLRTRTGAGFSAATRTANGNTPPTADAGLSYSIPVSTPFALTAVGTDANGDALTYDWEQVNGGAVVPLNGQGIPSSTVTSGPVFRARLPVTSPTRLFPTLNTILSGVGGTPAGTGTRGEQLPSVSRSMNFAVVVRDNRAGGGGVAIAKTVVSTVAGGAFSVSSFNTAQTIEAGSAVPINWVVGNTNSAPINTSQVNILLSTDNGQTFPTVLAAATDNDGSETVTIPAELTSTNARIKVEAVGNIFFDINNALITIIPGQNSTPPDQPDLTSVSDTGVSDTDDLTRLNNADIDSVLIFEVPGTVNGAEVRVYANGILIGSAFSSGGTTTVVTDGNPDPINNPTLLGDGPHAITATQIEPGKPESAASSLLTITVDATAPVVVGTPAFTYLTSPHRVNYEFSEDISSTLDASDFAAELLQTSTPVAVDLTQSGTSAEITFSGQPILPSADYEVVLTAAGVTDAAGNALDADNLVLFFFQMADANHDRSVNLADFNILRSNFGQTGQNFGDGDFDYNGTVNLADFNILRGLFGTTLTPPRPNGLFGGNGDGDGGGAGVLN